MLSTQVRRWFRAVMQRFAGRTERFSVVDLGSFNGTLLNDRRIVEPELLHHNDRIELGPGGPTIRFLDPANPPPRPRRSLLKMLRSQPWKWCQGWRAFGQVATMVLRSESPLQISQAARVARVFLERPFGNTRTTDHWSRRGVQYSSRWSLDFQPACCSCKHNSNLTIEDLNSTNGTYVNGARITGRKSIRPEDVIQIGPFVLRVHPQRGITVFDTRAKTRIDVFQVTKEVPNRSGPGKVRLLDEVCLSIQPNEFVGLLGPSGAGKSTLMDSLNGMRPASSGQVLVNNLDLYQHLESLKLSIGYVPQDDIIHRELTVYRTLYYVARLATIARHIGQGNQPDCC